MRRLTITALFFLAAITVRANQVEVVKARISDLAAKLPPANAIEMLLRAAAAAGGRSAGAVGPGSQPEVLGPRDRFVAQSSRGPRDRTIVSSLMALDPENAETLILSGSDRVYGVNELARFWNQRGEFGRGANVLP
jgi:hypothetical protein